MTDLFVFIIRCLIIILATWLITNFIGKKSIAQITPYDLAILFIISNVAAQPLVSHDSFKTAFGMILLGLSIVLIARLSLLKVFYKLDSSPSVIIENGRINEAELKKNRMSIYMLRSLLRVQGYFKLADIRYAVLETTGDIAIIPKASARPVTTSDLTLSPAEEVLTYAVIIDGQLSEQALCAVHLTKQWLVHELQVQYQAHISDVLYAEVDDNHVLFVDLYKKNKEASL
ncbi:hypothetical protein A374_10073 [Fictibacillus macauensis ZFHKF-1]|uniref:YetF C-terminal domain-containing protein n=1 Tax=Fictibacillus macauensis ZFHKF-1 TaxID=1196324 RepID=I8J1G9_9BACL|nr:DUF421 domain-containing protein [Fictibacillus macauensis]EIT85576.1 hypothetical protein A374_10073 [Fictibacillus macauensis ZFHKF-1]